MQLKIGSFEIDVGDDGVGLVTFSRPPVNAVSLSVYQDIGRLVEAVETNQSIRVVVLTAPDDARAGAAAPISMILWEWTKQGAESGMVS